MSSNAKATTETERSAATEEISRAQERRPTNEYERELSYLLPFLSDLEARLRSNDHPVDTNLANDIADLLVPKMQALEFSVQLPDPVSTTVAGDDDLQGCVHRSLV